MRHPKKGAREALSIARTHPLTGVQSSLPQLDGQCLHKFGIQKLLCSILQRDGYYELCHESKDFPCRFKKVTSPRKPKPTPASASLKVESFDLIANDFSNDSGLKDYVKLPSRDRTESEPPTFNDSRIQDEKKPDSPFVRGVE